MAMTYQVTLPLAIVEVKVVSVVVPSCVVAAPPTEAKSV